MTGFKEQMIEHEQQLIVVKQRFRESQDELEELRSLIQDQAAQLEDYRNKYLQVFLVDTCYFNGVLQACMKMITETTGATTSGGTTAAA